MLDRHAVARAPLLVVVVLVLTALGLVLGVSRSVAGDRDGGGRVTATPADEPEIPAGRALASDPGPPADVRDGRPDGSLAAEGDATDASGANHRDEPADRGIAAGTDSDAVGVDGPSARASQRGRLVVHHVGDVLLDPGQVAALGVSGPEAVWDGVRDTFAAADLVLANLECTASDRGEPQDKEFVFRCDLDALPAMRGAGVDVVNLANNHSGDHGGVQGMLDSAANLAAVGMIPVGVGVDAADAFRARIVEVAGWRVAVLGFGGVVPEVSWFAGADQPGQATGYDAARMAQAVAVAADDADLVVVTVHWGTERALEPRPEDVVKAQAMIDAGADVVFGHHVHRLQPLERVDAVPVFWNLGNFVWPRLSPESATSAVAVWTVEPDGTSAACLVPFEIDAMGVPHPTGADPDCR
jgi:hypothetical protein